MESEKKRRKYSTSSNDSDTTDSKLTRGTMKKCVCVRVCVVKKSETEIVFHLNVPPLLIKTLASLNMATIEI